ncbi:MAG TPA: response regulator transcription factor [Vicinamibacterales bacterium]|jgi:DNA-binding response OmpR family regulator|nr:response regulator transcription factor [Vicinamibacterales bacterium]
MPTPESPAKGPERKRALVVEDEPHIRELVALHLGLEGMAVTEAGAGDVALTLTETEPFDLVVLDLMLPKVDGVAVCRAIRRQRLNADVPILMLTARREESDKVLGLDSGADDYLTKPFGVRELVARARALLRRPRASRGLETPAGQVVTAGPLVLDPARRRAVVRGDMVDLTPHEFDVLYLLAAHPGIVFTRDMLLERIWTNDTHVTERSVDTLVKRLRQKIEADTREPQLILTVWGTGYKFADV